MSRQTNPDEGRATSIHSPQLKGRMQQAYPFHPALIERQGRPEERSTLTAVTAILTGLRFGYAERWLELLGGKKVVSDSPVYQKWMEEQACATRQADIVAFLKARFGAVPEDLAARIRSVTDLGKLEEAVTLAGRCTSLDAFRRRFAKG